MCRKSWLLILPFYNKKLGGAYAFEHNFCSQGRLKGWKYVCTTTNWAMKSFWEQGKYHWVLSTLLRNLSLLNCRSLLEIILMFEIISYPGHFMPIHANSCQFTLKINTFINLKMDYRYQEEKMMYYLKLVTNLAITEHSTCHPGRPYSKNQLLIISYGELNSC